ncbi:tol-pal system YbgF family protein [Umezawaea endophytica]|uniref:Tetratricopeptide repeat protein n=1 Tax=Umezawaea endophytica TaxID=1654476 RepID=A0A9X3AID1_9PSEU|nr:tetratricopeptide repeat protein [Umezawaea endophytica]MCS7482957.1 tetratricopeptide repeat protein [Umezawaea endophytica]
MSTLEPLSSSMPEAHTVTGRLGAADVDALENTTRILRALDQKHGGARCLDIVISALSAADALLDSPAGAAVAVRTRTAVADLHNLAGWVYFDAGSHHDALRELGRALELADNGELAANVRYRLGRVFLHHNGPGRASEEFRLGAMALTTRGSALSKAILCANQAWAQAMMGIKDEALVQISRAAEQFEKARRTAVPGWASFFTATDLLSMTGVVYTELAQTSDRRFASLAVPALSAAAADYGPGMPRSKVFCLIALATALLTAGRTGAAMTAGHEALELCPELESVRVLDRFVALGRLVGRFDDRADARHLLERINTFRHAARTT